MVRPRMRNCQPSSRVIDASAAPLIIAARSRTQRKLAPGPIRLNCPVATWRCVVLSASHIVTDSVSRARRALSRAAARVAAIEAGAAGS